MKIKDIIQSKWIEFTTLCKSNDVKALYAFGSSVTNEFNENNSDIDFVS